MMRFLAPLFAGLLILSSSHAPIALAQDATHSQCIDEVYASLQREMLFERSVIFGQKTAANLPRGAIRFDTLIKPWIKTADNEWKTYGNEDSPLTDASMDSRSYPPRRRGILETKKALTSELIPPILQTMRAMQCRLRYVCEAALRSRASEIPQSFQLEADGCIKMTVQRFNSCRTDESLEATSIDISTMNVQVGVCDAAAQEMMKREMSMLTLVMAYDGSYRSFLQFAGITQSFGSALRQPVLDVLSKTVMTLQNLGSGPGFTAQCD
jgi:hypothetical protein